MMSFILMPENAVKACRVFGKYQIPKYLPHFTTGLHWLFLRIISSLYFSLTNQNASFEVNSFFFVSYSSKIEKKSCINEYPFMLSLFLVNFLISTLKNRKVSFKRKFTLHLVLGTAWSWHCLFFPILYVRNNSIQEMKCLAYIHIIV